MAVVSCKEEVPKDYVTLSGTITNQNSDSLIVAQRSIIKTIKVDAEGKFSDTLKVDPGNYVLFDGKNRIEVYLKNGTDLNIKVDVNNINETLAYTGIGSGENNYIIKKNKLQIEQLSDQSIFELEKNVFNSELKRITNVFSELLSNTKNLDSLFVAQETERLKRQEGYLTSSYNQKQTLLALKGNDSPKFVDYENYAGGTTSLEDLKGKYVYIDLWATWCGPCKKEIRFLKEVEKAYHGKNIAFVSISVDKKNAYKTWKSMVAEKELSGIQLWAKEDKTFAQAYNVTGIPRFILIDPKGKVVSADAPRPSDTKLKDLFNELNI
jgi:thiol-disulfide isomerase/thioredoxin